MSDLPAIQGRIARLVELRRYGDARRMLRDAFALEPDNARSHLLAAEISLDIEDYADARASLERVLAVDPDNETARGFMFLVQYETNDFVEAERTILGLLRENPDSAHYYAFYGRLMLKTLNVEKARALAGEALRLDPQNTEARVVGLLVGIIEGETASATQQLELLVRDDPDALHVAWSIVAVLQSKRRYREAMEVMRRILHAHPDDKDVVEALIDLRTLSHWSTAPLWPLIRYGWAGSAVLWGIAVAGLVLGRRFAPEATPIILAAYVVFVFYSWLYPPMLKRWLKARGF